MKTNKKLMTMGIIVLIAGISAALMSFVPSRILQYVFVVASLVVGALGVAIGKNTKRSPMRSNYASSLGFVLIGLSIAVVIWATSLMALMNVIGLFLLALAFIEFAMALQILIGNIAIPWNVVGIKLTLSATAAIGAASILTIAGFHGYMALLVIGLLFVTIGLTIIQVSRLRKDTGTSVIR
jgi:hypothetical protein